MDITVLELHLHDGIDFNPRGFIGGSAEELEEATDDETAIEGDTFDDEDEADTGGGRGVVVALFALVALGIGAAVARRLQNEEDEEVEVAVEEVQ